MPPNERWRSFKIVTPKEPNREQELIGGLQNALLRGENINKAKQSFISAGYDPKEIEAAAQKISTNQQPTTQSTQKLIPKNQQPKTPTTTNPNRKEKISKIFLIILISISALILIGATLLGLFWNKIF